MYTRMPGRAILLALVFITTLSGRSTGWASLTQPTNSLEAGIRNAILRGDAQELRVLMGQAGELSSSDAAIAQRALASMETLGAQDSSLLAERYGVDWANKIAHALKSETDGAVKRALLERYGSAEAAFLRVHKVVETLKNLPRGVSERLVNVDGLEVLVRIYVQRGVAQIATILKKK